MASISFKNIEKIYPGGVTAVKDFNLEIADGEFVVLVGPSGCGKSTTLRMIAGLEHITGGELYIGDRLINNVQPKNRDVSMVFQNYALYPHLTVFDNIAFGLKIRKIPKKIIEQKVLEVASILDLSDLLKRKPKALSGGQRQRVALGRAIVRDPVAFLLDEPLSNLDAKLRSQMRTEISRLHNRLGATFVYVTHDQTEAMTMGDRLVVMKDGVIQQVDSPRVLYESPQNLFVAGFIGSPRMNLFEARLHSRDGDVFVVFDGGELPIHEPRQKARLLEGYVDKSVMVGVRPECFHLEDEISNFPEACQMEAKVELSEMVGAEVYLHIICGETRFIAAVPPRGGSRPGESVGLWLDCAKLYLFDKDSEEIIK